MRIEPHQEKDRGGDGVQQSHRQPHDQACQLLIAERGHAPQRHIGAVGGIPRLARKNEQCAEYAAMQHRGEDCQHTCAVLLVTGSQQCPPEQA